MQPTDLARLSLPSDPRLHPDGKRVAFTVSRPDLDEDRYNRAIWLASVEGGARPFTAGPGDGSPRWSSDGSRLAFLRTGPDKDGQAQVAVLPVDGGEAEVLTSFDRGAEAIEWSPDGRWLVAVAVTWEEEWADLDDEARNRKPRRIGSFPYRFDGMGWLHDRRRHLWLVDPTGGEEPRCLTPGKWDETDPDWRPDSAAIAFLSDRSERQGLEPGIDVLEVDLSSGETKTLAPRGNWNSVAYRPDGVLHLVGDPDPEGWLAISAVWRVEPDGGLSDLTGHLDRSVDPFQVSPAPAGPQWLDDGFTTLIEERGRVRVIRVGEDGTIDEVVGGERVVTGASPSSDASVVAFVVSEPTDPGEVWVKLGEEERRVTDLNAGFRDEVDLVTPQYFELRTDDAVLDVWVYLPPGDHRVPLLLNIHGGPASAYGWTFFDEFQVGVGAGYGVVATNPRGSSGSGAEHLKAVVGKGWGAVDLADITAVVAAALEREPRLDPERMGVMGGSYGGFLTAWVTANDQRWKSAIVERGALVATSFAGTSDIAETFSLAYYEAAPPDAWDVLWEKSPLALAHQVTTPTLIIHSENDFRCPIEQAEQYFLALLRAGTTVEMLRFPGEGHEMSRSGKPLHRQERFEAVLDWHSRHLLSTGNPTKSA